MSAIRAAAGIGAASAEKDASSKQQFCRRRKSTNYAPLVAMPVQQLTIFKGTVPDRSDDGGRGEDCLRWRHDGGFKDAIALCFMCWDCGKGAQEGGNVV